MARVLVVGILLLLVSCQSDGVTGSGSPGPRVRIDPRVFAYDEQRGLSNETFLISGNFAPADGIAALKRAAARFMNVDERGTEHRDVFASPPVDESGELLYTPNYVSDPRVTAAGIEMYVDCKGGIEPPMVRRFIRILQEELAPLGDVRVTAVE